MTAQMDPDSHVHALSLSFPLSLFLSLSHTLTHKALHFTLTSWLHDSCKMPDLSQLMIYERENKKEASVVLLESP